MPRSLKKGPFVDKHLAKKVEDMNKSGQKKAVEQMQRGLVLFPDAQLDSKYFGPDAKEQKKAILLSFFATSCEPCKRSATAPSRRTARPRTWRASATTALRSGACSSPASA